MARIIIIKDDTAIRTYYPRSFSVEVELRKIGKWFEQKRQVWTVEVKSYENYYHTEGRIYYFNKQANAINLQRYIMDRLIGDYPELDISDHIRELREKDV